MNWFKRSSPPPPSAPRGSAAARPRPASTPQSQSPTRGIGALQQKSEEDRKRIDALEAELDYCKKQEKASKDHAESLDGLLMEQQEQAMRFRNEVLQVSERHQRALSENAKLMAEMKQLRSALGIALRQIPSGQLQLSREGLPLVSPKEKTFQDALLAVQDVLAHREPLSSHRPSAAELFGEIYGGFRHGPPPSLRSVFGNGAAPPRDVGMSDHEAAVALHARYVVQHRQRMGVPLSPVASPGRLKRESIQLHQTPTRPHLPLKEVASSPKGMLQRIEERSKNSAAQSLASEQDLGMAAELRQSQLMARIGLPVDTQRFTELQTITEQRSQLATQTVYYERAPLQPETPLASPGAPPKSGVGSTGSILRPAVKVSDDY